MKNPRKIVIGTGVKIDFTIGTVRELVRGDLETLRQTRAAPIVQSLRDTHHRVARLLASGLRIGEVVAQSGYGYGRINTLRKDPAFLDLVETYRKEVASSFREEQDEYHSMLVENRMAAERMLADKLAKADELDEPLPTRDLIAISRDAADRTGYGKKQTNVNVNVDFASALERARARSGKVITVVRAPSLAGPAASGEPPLCNLPDPPQVQRTLRRI